MNNYVIGFGQIISEPWHVASNMRPEENGISGVAVISTG